MDSGNADSGLSPSREVPESVRRLLAWLAEEFECSEGEAVCLLAEAARELRNTTSDGSAPARSLAGILQNAAALFQLLRELRPGGLPLDELETTITRFKIRAHIEKAGGSVPSDEETVLRLLEIHQALEKEGLKPDEFLAVAFQAGKLVDLKELIEELGGTEEGVRELLGLGRYLEAKGLEVGDVREVAEFYWELEGLGFGIDSARPLASALAKARERGGTVAQAAERLLELARRGVEIEGEVARLQATREKLRRQVAELSEEASRLQKQVQPLQRAVCAGEMALDHIRHLHRSLSARVCQLWAQAQEEERRLMWIQGCIAKEKDRLEQVRHSAESKP